jgi:hypothetical protein
MLEAKGSIRVGGTQAAGAAIYRRLCGPSWRILAPMIALYFFGLAAGAMASAIWPDLAYADFYLLVGLALTVITMAPFLARIQAASLRRNMAARDFPLETNMELRLTPDKLLYASYGCEGAYEWTVVSELFEQGDYWLFMVGATFLVVPKRWFKSAEEEQAFLREALRLMPPAAQQRSLAAKTRAGF